MKKSIEQVIAMWVASAAILICILLIAGCETVPSKDPVPRPSLSSSTPIIQEEPEPVASVVAATSTTVIIPEADPAPLMRMGEALALEPSTSITTNNSPLLKSLPNRRIIRPNCMTDREWSDFLESRTK